jgi:hypothetical protein
MGRIGEIMGDRVGNAVVTVGLTGVTPGRPPSATQVAAAAFITVAIRLAIIVGHNAINRGLTAHHLRRTATHTASQQHRGGRKKQPIGTHGQDLP